MANVIDETPVHPDQDAAIISGGVIGVVVAAGTWCGSVYLLRAAAWIGAFPRLYATASPIRWTPWLIKTAANQILHSAPGGGVIVLGWVSISVFLSLIAGIFSGLAWWRGSLRPAERVIGGPQVLDGGRRTGDGVEITPGWKLDQREERENILCLAGAGGGKTTLIKRLIRQARERGDRMLILDFKKDFTEMLLGQHDEARPVTLIAPWDRRSCRWQIGEDLRSTPAIDEFLVAMVPDGREAQWARGARAMADGAISSLREERGTDWGFGDLVATLTAVMLDLPALRGIAATYAPETLLSIDTSQATRTSFLTNIGQALSQLTRIASAESLLPAGRKWSVRRWMETPAATVILGWLPEGTTMSRSLVLPAIQTAITGLLSLPDCDPNAPEPQNRRVWLFLDEIGQAGNVPALTGGLTSLRSKGVRVVLGLQTLSQIEESYGKPALATWMGQSGTKLISQLRSAEDQKSITDLIGQHEIQRLQASHSDSPAGARSHSLTWQNSQRDAIRRHEIGGLGPRKDGSAIDFLILRDGATWRHSLPRERKGGEGNKAPALLPTRYLSDDFRRPPPQTLGHVVDLERFRRLAPPNPNDQPLRRG